MLVIAITIQTLCLTNAILGPFVGTAMKAAGTDNFAVLEESASGRADLPSEVERDFIGSETEGHRIAVCMMGPSELEAFIQHPMSQCFAREMEFDDWKSRDSFRC